jgi:hypothetical protein
MDVIYIGHPLTFISAKITKKGVKFVNVLVCTTLGVDFS